MLSKIYLEITNACNLSCPFCHGTSRKTEFLSYSDFSKILEKLRGKTEYLYFHLMGEPLLHPRLDDFLQTAKKMGFTVMITTNGTLLEERGAVLFERGCVKKVSVSLQALESRGNEDVDKYLNDVSNFAYRCAEKWVICVLRLWNVKDDPLSENAEILERLHRLFPDTWIKNRSGFKLIDAPLGQKEVYLEFGNRFSWPDIQSTTHFDFSGCPALSRQLGILCDGTVVPCCMDANGEISLGNILKSSLDEILSSERARMLKESFESGKPCEQLCQSCGYVNAAKRGNI